MTSPYKTTPIWDEHTLPPAIRSNHSTKAGVWGILRVLEGEVWLKFANGSEHRATPDLPQLIPPQEIHHVDSAGSFRMQVEFYNERPELPPLQ